MGIPFGWVNFPRRIYPEVHLLAKLFQNIESNGFASLSQSWRVQGAVTITVCDFEQNKKPPHGEAWRLIVKCYCLLGPLTGGCDVIPFRMRRIIFTSLAVITLIAIIACGWVGAGERLSLFLDRFKTVRLASLPMRPLSAYNGKEGTYYAGAFFIGKEEMTTANGAICTTRIENGQKAVG
jgi:hypothetical protein